MRSISGEGEYMLAKVLLTMSFEDGCSADMSGELKRREVCKVVLIRKLLEKPVGK